MVDVVKTDVKAKSKLVRNYKIANELIQLGYPVKKIVQDKKFPDKNRPIYIFDNTDGLEEIFSGLVIKAAKEKEARIAEGENNVGDRPSEESSD